MKLTRGRTIGLIVLLVLIFLAVDAFVPASAHPVHSSGATPLNVRPFASTQKVYWEPGAPAESLSGIKCNGIFGSQPVLNCGPSEIAAQFPTLSQAPSTLYYVWAGCIPWSGHGPVIPWKGFNVEYFPANRTLVIHCYIGEGWVYLPDRMFGVAGGYATVLLAIPTSAIGAGRIDIREDDRIEHLAGDLSTEYGLTAATIS